MGNQRKDFKKIITIAVLFLFINTANTNPEEKLSSIAETLTIKTLTQDQIYVRSIKLRMNHFLTGEVEKYIKKLAPGSNLNSEFLVSKCLEYDIDIIFVLSQALLESHFGTRGKAVETNSVWNVGTYDNGKILYRYEFPDDSLEPYLELVSKKYLMNVSSEGDTLHKDESHLIQDKGYINYKGLRYASAKSYEKNMRKLMLEINMGTMISFYQNILKLDDDTILTFFSPLEKLEENTEELIALK